MWKALLLGLSLLSAPAWAQSTPTQITDEINNLLPSGRSSISAEVLRQVLLGMNASYVPITGGAGLTLSTLTIGTAQSSIGQISQATAAYPGVNVCSDLTRIQVGGITPSMELCGSSNSNPSTSAQSISLEIPAGTYTGPDTSPDSAQSLYALNHNTQKFGVGQYVLSGVAVPGSLAMGINVSTVNGPLFSATSTTGMSVRFQTTLEADTNFYLNGAVNPSGIVKGIQSLLNATARATGGMNAFEADAVPGGQPWDCAFCTNTGAANVGLSVAPVSTGATQNSQTVNLTATKGDGTPVLGSIFEDTVGRLTLASSGGVLLSTGITLASMPTTGTATGSLCVTAANTVFIKTTSGACF